MLLNEGGPWVYTWPQGGWPWGIEHHHSFWLVERLSWVSLVMMQVEPMPGGIHMGSHCDYSLRALHGCGKGVLFLIAWELGAAAWRVEMLWDLWLVFILCALPPRGSVCISSWCGVLIFLLACTSLQILFFCLDFLSCFLSCSPAGPAVSVWPGHMSCPLF